MKRTILAAAATLLFAAWAANADMYCLVGCNDLDDPNCWYTSCDNGAPLDSIPGADDRVVICSGLTSNLSADTTWDTIDIRGTLNILAGYTLTLENNDDNLGGGVGCDHSTVGGTINLLGSGSTLKFTCSDHCVFGVGLIDGQHDNALIEIACDQKVTSEATIEGNCQIKPGLGISNSIFVNNGTVHANNAGTLEVDPDSIGDSSGKWEVSTSSQAVLKIHAPSAATHDGDVIVSRGVMDVDESFATTGNLTFSGGTIDVGSGATFSFNQ